MENFFLYLIKSAGLLLVFLAFYHLLLKSDTSFRNNRFFLLGGILASAVLPAIYFTRKVIVDAVVPDFSLNETNLPAAQFIIEEPLLSEYQILLAIYLGGVAVMLGRMLMQLFSLKKIISNGKFSVKNGFKHVHISDKIAPFSFLNYIVYNPSLYSSSELENILKHETVHVTQWHSIDVFLANINLIYQWFNPFAWRYLKTLQQNLEYIADREAVKEASCKKEYQKTLVKISVENFNPALTNSFYQSFIKKRIVMLNNNSISKNQTLKTALIFPVLLILMLSFNIKTEAQVKIKNENISEITTKRVSGAISKESEESSLNFIKKIFEKENIQIDFEKVQRSPEGFITAISINILNRNTNTSGNFSKNDPNGISTFLIYFEDGETGFADISASVKKGKSAGDVLSKVGKDALYIINNEEYSTEQLNGKTIAMDSFVLIDAENAKSKYGDKARDGVIFISDGKIIEDLTSELKEIDKQDKKVTKTFLQVKKGEKPHIWEVSNNPEENSAESRTRVSVSSNASAINIDEGTPVYILNGKVVERTTINSLNEDNIKEIRVVKGDSAISAYGNAARNGVILITTKPSKLKTSINNVKFIPEDKEEKEDLVNDYRSGKKKILVILNGKEQPKTFNLNSIDPDNIKTINVQKGEDVIKEYGKDAKDGLIIISTEEVVNPGTTTSNNGEGMQFNPSKVKTISITGESDDILATQLGTRMNPANVIYFPQEEKPLVIVDGEQKDSDFDMNSINPEIIESVNILKGDNATEEYGKKGKNGVILIRTKKGKKNNEK